MLQQLQPPLILGDFPMDPGLLLPYFKSGIGHHCPVTKETGQNFISQRDLSGKLVRMYDNCTAIVIAEPPPPHVATTPLQFLAGWPVSLFSLGHPQYSWFLLSH